MERSLEIKNYLIPFSGLKLGDHLFEFKIEDTFFKEFNSTEIEKADILAKVLLHKKSSMLSLNFTITGKVEFACDICNENYFQNIKNDFDLIVKFSDYEHIDNTDEIIVLPTNEHTLYIAQQLYEFIHLALPTKRVHENDDKCNQDILEKIYELSYHKPETSDTRWDNLKKLK
jgi:uncharacterized metal-binding protein YceD (DUF177 family)